MSTLAEQVESVDSAWLADNAEYSQILKSLKKLRAKDLRNQLEAKGISSDGLSKVLVVRLALALFIEDFGVPSPPVVEDIAVTDVTDSEAEQPDAQQGLDSALDTIAETSADNGEGGEGGDGASEEKDEEIEPEYFEEDILRAAWSGDLEGVYKCLTYRRALADAVDKYGRTPLCLACIIGHTKIVHALVNGASNILHQANDGMTPMHYAARGGYLEIVKYLLHRRQQAVDRTNELGITPLMEACSNGHVKVVHFLLSHEAFVNARAKDGCSALLATIQSQTPAAHKVVEMLMRYTIRTAPVHSFVASALDPLSNDEKMRQEALTLPVPLLKEMRQVFENSVEPVDSPWTAARINVSLREGTSAIHFVARNADLFGLGLLLGAKARVDTLDELGLTPLVYAVETGDLECILLLLAFGADPNVVPNDHKTPVWHAVETEDIDTLRLLLTMKGNAEVVLPENKMSALHLAAKKGFAPELAELLLENGAEPENVMGGQHEHGSTALLLASKYGNFKVVQHLIRYGANLEVVDAQRRSALFMAASKGYKDIVAALCNGGARINTQDRWKTTALHAAVKSKHVDVIETLIDMGALVNTRNDYSPYHGATSAERQTPIENVINARRTDLLRVLLNADDVLDAVNAADYLGNTPLHRAAHMGYKEAIDLLLEAKASVNATNGWTGAALHSALGRRQQKCAYQLMHAGADLNIVTQWGSLPTDFYTDGTEPRGARALNMALHLQLYGVARDLIRLKSDPDAELGNGATALNQCLDADQFDIAQVLLDAKADPNKAEDEDGLAPIHLIIDSENIEMLRQLILHRADVNQQMSDGATPLHLAAAKGSMKVLKMLIMKKADLNICMNDGESAIATAFRKQTFNLLDELRAAGADCSQVDQDELDKWQMMYQAHYETKRRDASLEDANEKRPRCGQCEHCLRNIYHLQRYGRAGKLRCKIEKQLILERTHHRAFFGPNEETGELTGGDKYFLWVDNKVDRKGTTRSLIYSGTSGDDQMAAIGAPQAKAKLDADGNERPAPSKTHTRDQLVKAFHARRKILDATVKESGQKLRDMMKQLQSKNTFYVRHVASGKGGAGRSVEYTDSPLKHGVNQRMTKNQWQLQLLDNIEEEEEKFLTARNELQCLDAWVRGDVVIKMQRLRRRSRRNGRQLELWYNAIKAMKGHKQNIKVDKITAWYRGVMARRMVRKLKLVREYNTIHNAATTIQKIFRGRRIAALIPGFKESARQHHLSKMATVLQRRYWEYQHMLQQREWFLQQMSLKNAAKLARLNHKATLIQKVVRGRIGRRKFFSIIGPRTLHGALKAPLEEYQDSGDIWKLLGKLNDTYKQLDARNEYEDTTSEMFVGSLVKWRADYEQKLAEQNRTKTFREQELKKAREVMLDANIPNHPDVVMGGKRHEWTEKGPKWLQKQGKAISTKTRTKKSRKKSRKSGTRTLGRASGFSGSPSHVERNPRPSADHASVGKPAGGGHGDSAFDPSKGLEPITVPASLERVPPVDPYDPNYKKYTIKLGGWAKSTNNIAVSSPFELESMEEPVSRLFLYACMKTYPPRLQGGLSFDEALKNWFHEPPSLKKVRDEQILRERVKQYEDVLREHNIHAIGDALDVDFAELGFAPELVENLNECLAIFKRRVRNKNANTIADSYTRVGKAHLRRKVSEPTAKPVHEAKSDAEDRDDIVEPNDSHGDASKAMEIQLQQRTQVLDNLLEARIADGELSQEKAAILREKLVAQFKIPVGKAVSAIRVWGPQTRQTKDETPASTSTPIVDRVRQKKTSERTVHGWILKLDQEHGINVHLADRETRRSETTSRAFKATLLASTHDKLLTYLVMRQHANFEHHDPQNAKMILGFPASEQFYNAFAALATLTDADSESGGHTDSWNVRRSRIQEMSKTAFQLAKPYILALKSAGIYTIADLLAIRHLLVSPSTPRSNAQMQAKFVALPNHQGGSLPKLPTPLQLAIHTALQHILALDGESPRAAKIHRSLTGRSVQDPNNGAATAMGGADTVKLPPIRNSRAASASNAGDPPPLRRAGTSSSVRSQGDNFPYHSYSPRAASADNGHQRGSLSHRTVDTHHSRSNPSSARR